MRESEVAQSCPTLSDPMDYSLPGSSIHGIFHDCGPSDESCGTPGVRRSRGSSENPEGPNLVHVVRADFHKEVACKPEFKQWIEVSQSRGELVERKL